MRLKFFKPDIYICQDDIGKLLGIGERRVWELVNDGVLPVFDKKLGLDPVKCVQAYIAYKLESELSRFRKKPLTQNMAKLEIQEKQNKISLQLADLKAKNLKLGVAQGKLVPLEIMEDLIAQAATSFRQAADNILPRIKMVYPDIPQAMIDEIDQITIMMLNDIADTQPDLSKYSDDTLQFLYEGDGDMQEAQQLNGDSVGG